MAEVPRHPEIDEGSVQRAEPGPAKSGLGGYVVGAAIAAVVLLVIVLHLTGVIQPPTH